MDVYIIVTVLAVMLLTPLVFKNVKSISMIIIAAVVILLFFTFHIGKEVYFNTSVSYLENRVYIDSLSLIQLFIIHSVSFAAALYSDVYIKRELREKSIDINRARLYYFLFALFVCSMNFLAVSNNVLAMWLGIEATTLSTAFLIAFNRTKLSLDAAWKYIIVCSVGIILGLVGIILFIYSGGGQTDSNLLNWTTLAEQYHALNANIAKIAFTFIFVGIGTKAALAPMHTWISDSYNEAPSAISAMMAGTVINLALYIIIRFYIIVRQCNGASNLKYLFILFGCISLIVSSFSILKQNNYKRLLAFSSVENIGIIALGIGIGGPLATFGALLHSVIHAMAKTLLFLVSGNIIAAYKTKRMDKIQYLIKTMPINASFLLVGMLVITGAPPFASFFSEFTILIAGIQYRYYIPMFIYGFSLLLAFAGFLMAFIKMVFVGEVAEYKKLEKDKENIMPIVILLLFIIGISIFYNSYLSVILNKAVMVISG